MIDGASYYKKQSQARGILGAGDARRMAECESMIFDRLILHHLPRDPQAAIYEAATGPGILQAWLHSRGFKNLQGSDFSDNEARVASQISPGIIHGDSLVDLQERCRDESLDVVIALDFLEHLPRERFVEFLALVFSKLKIGGILIMRGPNGDTPIVGSNLYNDITHVWAYTTVCLRALLGISGFSHISFADDTRKALHHGRWWKLPLMVLAQWSLSTMFWAATRFQVKYWGASLYVYARK